MKLEMTLCERPGFLHAVPLFNLFALMLMVFSLGPAFVQQAGVTVDLPPSEFQMERFSETIVVTLMTGQTGPMLYLGREQISQAELGMRLEKMRESGAATKACVLLQTAPATPVRTEREISELILAKGFRLALVGRSQPVAPQDEAKQILPE